MAQIDYRWFRRIVLFLLGLIACLCLSGVGSRLAFAPAIAQSPAIPRSTDAALQRYQAGQFLEAIALWEQVLPHLTNPQERAVLYTNLGQAYRQVGRLDRAIAQWDAAIKLHQTNQTPEKRQAIPPLLAEQAQAYSELGQHSVAIERASDAIAQAQKNQDFVTQAAALGALGNAQWALGNYEAALSTHQKSLTLACQIDRPDFIAAALNNLGNVFASRAERFRYQASTVSLEGDRLTEAELIQFANRDLNIALAAYQQSAKGTTVGGNRSVQTQALLNLNRLLKDLPANYVIPSFPELSCLHLNFSTLLTAAQKASPMPQLPAQVTTQKPEQKAATTQTVPNATSRLLNYSPILVRLEAEPDSQDKAYGYINLANTLLSESNRNPQKVNEEQVQTLLNKALLVARKISDARAESFALGTWGRLHEQIGQFAQAMELTRQAQFVAQKINAADSLYRWQWQIGRLLKATGQPEQAIAAYEQAIATLQSIRSDIIVANQDLQFDFRDSVEPVYRELISLLLETDSPPRSSLPPPTFYASTLSPSHPPTLPPSSTTNSQNLEKVLTTLELLKLAELQNFFGDDCVQVAKEEAAKEQTGLSGKGQFSPAKAVAKAIDPQAAVIYSIVLKDRTYLLLKLPNGSLKKYPIVLERNSQTTPARRELLQAQIDQLRTLLEKRSTEEYLVASQLIYDALLRPLEADLRAANPSTLVFINDGVLRKVPMAALHDGQQFLIQKYPLATTPSLSLTSRHPLNRSNLKALVMGLTLEQPPFAALPNVKTEVLEVQEILGGTKLIDQDFTLKRIQERLKNNNYPIIHMATHGKFGPDAANTFLLTYSDRITIDKLDELLRSRTNSQPVELLTLSACQTAAGDDRATLGIAGVAVRAGVKSAVATLWFINDQATVPLIEEFYTQLLKPGTTKAQALQRAQVKLISDRQYSHPAVWSPFILIGNWM